MLLSLLPLTGFAADFKTEATVTVDDIYFGLGLATTDVNLQVNGVQITEIELDKTSSKVNYYTTAECTTKATLATGSLTPVPGTYYVKILPSTSANSNWAAGKVIVKAMPLKVTVSNASKAFNNKGAEDTDEVLGEITAVTQLNKSNADVAITGDDLTAIKAQMTVGRAAGKNKGNYKYTVSISNSNYSIASNAVTGTFTINTKAFPSTRGTTGNTYSVTVTNNEKTYNGSNQGATLTIVDNALGYTLVSGDYTIKYDGATSAKNYKAGGYVISFETKGNYAASTITLNVTGDKKLVIAQQPLDIYVDDLTQVYDGTTIIKNATFSYSGLVGSDITNAQPFGDNFEAYIPDLGTATYLAAKNYTLKAKVKTSADFSGTTYANYAVTFTEIGQLTVNPRPVTITVANQSKEFGGADPAFTFTVAGVPTPDDGTGATTTTTVSGTTVTDLALLTGLYTAKRTNTTEEVGAHANAIDVELKAVADQSAAEKAVLQQYDITVKKGKFTINTASLTVTPKKVTITYGEDYDLNDFEVIATNAAGKRVTLTKTPKVKFKTAAYNTTNPTDANVYIMVVDGEIAADGYDGATATRNEGQFIINKKAVTAVLDAQTLMVGDYENALLTSKVSFVEDPEAETPVDGIVGDDVIGFKLGFNIGSGDGQLPDADIDTQAEVDTYNANTSNVATAIDWTSWTVDGTNTFGTYSATAAYNAAINPSPAVTDATVLTAAHVAAAKAFNETQTGAKHAGLLAAAATAGTFAKGVTITEVASTPAKPNKNANYDITWTGTGLLKVVTNTGLALLSDDDDITNVTKLDGENITGITLDLNPRNGKKLPASTTRIWDAKQWNTLVLPFDISVAELSQAFGYAIVNVVDPSKTTENNVQFKLEMDEVKANTPFTIKTAKKLKDTDAAKCITTTGIINFPGTYEIAAPTAAQKAGVNAGMGYKFVPVYETLTVDNTKTALRFLLGNNANWAKIGESSTATWDIVPFAAYVDLTAAAAPEMVTFTFQELDGSTTTVKAIESGLAKANGYANDGWYNLNGVKMQGAPSQKGVYIQNGKKVVLK